MKGKVAIITGASSGIGKAIAAEFASRGAKLVIGARRINLLQELEKELTSKFNTEILCIKTDVSIEGDCRNLIDQAVKRFEKIDILVNNAGLTMRALYNEMDLKVLERLMNVNFWGNAYCTKFALPYLLRTKGSVVSISSISGYAALPTRTAYCASKFAINGLMESLRMETLKTGLHVMVVAPGFTTSEIRKNALVGDGTAQGETPRNEEKMQPPERVARKIARGIKRRKREMIISSLGWWTIAFNKFVPGFVDWSVHKFVSHEKDSLI